MKESDKPQTVFVVDDDPLFCKLINALLLSEALMVESYDCGRTFLEEVNPDRRGCALIDLAMPQIHGVELQTQMQNRGILMPVIFITATADVATTAAVMRQGALDLIEKPFDSVTLVQRVKEALAADTLMTIGRVVRRNHQKALSQLTPREREVMDLAVIGLANKQVAMKLAISERTVEIHRSRFMRKMQVESFADLVSRHSTFTQAA